MKTKHPRTRSENRDFYQNPEDRKLRDSKTSQGKQKKKEEITKQSSRLEQAEEKRRHLLHELGSPNSDCGYVPPRPGAPPDVAIVYSGTFSSRNAENPMFFLSHRTRSTGPSRARSRTGTRHQPRSKRNMRRER